MNKRHVLAAAAIVAATAYALPSEAAPKDKDPYVTPTEAGCFDILGEGTTSTFKRVIEKAQQDTVVEAAGLYGPFTLTYQERGIFDGTLQLAAPACADAVYVITLTEKGTGAPVERFTVSGDGRGSQVVFEELAGTASSCVDTVFSIEDRFGTEIDRSPDSGVDPVEACDGGGAGSYTN